MRRLRTRRCKLSGSAGNRLRGAAPGRDWPIVRDFRSRPRFCKEPQAAITAWPARMHGKLQQDIWAKSQRSTTIHVFCLKTCFSLSLSLKNNIDA